MADEPDNPEAERAPSTTAAYLVRVQGAAFGPVYALDPAKPASLGRASDNTIIVTDEECSRYHAKLFADTAGWRVQDLGSTNGTHVNGKRVERAALIRTGDRVSIGDFVFVFATDLTKLPVEADQVEIQVGDGLFVQQRRKRPFAKPAFDSATLRSDQWERSEIPKPAIKRLARCILALGLARDPAGFADAFLFALLEGTAADAGAILEGVKAESVLPLAERVISGGSYVLPSAQSLELVLKDREAILAADVVARKKGSSVRRSTIVAPVHDGHSLIGFVHLYSIDASRPMTGDDLDLVLGLAEHLGPALVECRKQQALALEGEVLRERWQQESEIVGTSSALANVVKKIALFAGNSLPVLIQGEAGTGKDLVARAIHQAGANTAGPYLVVRCQQDADNYVESELFGHERDAFASAYSMEHGKAELARGGTLMLDEVGALAGSLQAKLVRALEGHGFERIGGAQRIPCNFRLMATTSRNLAQLVKEGKFRGDLFERIAKQSLTIPPLRERPQDVPLLAQHFLRQFATDAARKVENFSPGALLKMGKHHWPGNVRELRNAIERAVLTAKGATVETDDLLVGSKQPAAGPAVAIYRPLPLDQILADHILRTLRFTGWNLVKSAEILAIDRPTLDQYIDKFHLRQSGAP